MTTTKSILTVSSIAIAMMFGGGVYLFMHLNTLIKPHIERMASQSLGAKVSIGNLDVAIKDKKASASDIRIANPAGFKKPYAVTIKSANITLEALAQTLVTINAIEVNGVETHLEVKETGTNFQALQKGMQPAKPLGEGEEPVKVIIKRFALDGATVNPSVTLIQAQDLKPVSLGPVVVNNIGVREGGVLPGEAAKQLVNPVLTAAAKAAGEAGYYQGLSPDVLKEMGINQLKGLTDQIGDKIKGFFN